MFPLSAFEDFFRLPDLRCDRILPDRRRRKANLAALPVPRRSARPIRGSRRHRAIRSAPARRSSGPLRVCRPGRGSPPPAAALRGGPAPGTRPLHRHHFVPRGRRGRRRVFGRWEACLRSPRLAENAERLVGPSLVLCEERPFHHAILLPVFDEMPAQGGAWPRSSKPVAAGRGRRLACST